MAVVSSLDDLFDNIEIWLESNVYQTNPYRKSLFSPVFYGEFHKETANGVIVTVHQYRKDFYKPRDWGNEDGFFLMNRLITAKSYDKFIKESPEELKRFATNLADLVKNGYILNKWDVKTVKARCFLGRANYEYVLNEYNETGKFQLDGAHIRTLKHKTPQYEGHKPFESSAGSFYYSTELCLGEFKLDYDHRFDIIEDIDENHIDIIEEENHNIASVLVEVDSF